LALVAGGVSAIEISTAAPALAGCTGSNC